MMKALGVSETTSRSSLIGSLCRHRDSLPSQCHTPSGDSTVAEIGGVRWGERVGERVGVWVMHLRVILRCALVLSCLRAT